MEYKPVYNNFSFQTLRYKCREPYMEFKENKGYKTQTLLNIRAKFVYVLVL